MEKDYRSNTNRQSRLRRVVAGPIAGLALAAAWLAAGTPAQAAEPAISGNVVRIGLLLDMSGVYADISGKGTATAAQMAIDDFGGSVMGKKIELLVADHQMKADVASSKAREWFDEQKVATIQDVTGAAASLAVLQIAKEKNRIVVFNGSASERLTNDLCSPVSVHYTYDSYALANTVAKALINADKKHGA